MWDNILSLAINYGIWAALFVSLMIYVLRDSKKRECKYQETIDKLADSLKIVEDIQEDITEIKFELRGGRRK